MQLVAELVQAYTRRKQWEAEMLAATIWNVIGKAWNESGGAQTGKGSGRRKVKPDAMLMDMGVRL